MSSISDREFSGNPKRPAVKPRRRRKRPSSDTAALSKTKFSESQSSHGDRAKRSEPSKANGSLPTVDTETRSKPVRRSWSHEQETEHIGQLQQLSYELREQGRVLYLPEIRPIVKTGDQAVCLCQLLYWFDQAQDGKPRARLRRERRPELWVAKTYEEFADEVGLTLRQARASLDGLCKSGLIEKTSGGFQGRKTTFWRIVPGSIENAILGSA